MEAWCRAALGKSDLDSVGEECCRAVLGKSGVEQCWGRVV